MSIANTPTPLYRNLKVEGATELFIYKLSQLFFATLATTTEEYDALFDDTFKSSQWIDWARRTRKKNLPHLHPTPT